jgi:outer membrane lipoprotein-sorting protein
MLKFKILLVSFLSLVFFCEFSLAVPPATVLQRIAASWNSSRTLQVDLWQLVERPDWEESSLYAGSLSVARDEKMRLDFSPLPQEATSSLPEAAVEYLHSASFVPEDIYLADGRYLMHWDRQEWTVKKQYLRDSEIPEILQALGGMEQFREEEFREDYDLRPVEEETVRNIDTYRLSFRPKSYKSSALIHYLLWVDREQYLPVRLEMRSREELIRVEFLNPRVNAPLPENIFDVQVPADARFVDRTRGL